MFSHDVKETNRTVSHHQQSHRFAWWSHVPKSYDGYFQKKLKSGGYVRMTPFPGCQWPQGSYRRGKVIFPFVWWMDSKKNILLQKNHLADWGFVIALSPESAYQPLDLLELVAACRPDPPTALPKTGRDPPAWPTQFVTSRYKVKVSHARSPKRPQLGSSTATMSQPKRFGRNT